MRATIEESFVLQKGKYFCKNSVWPRKQILNPEEWLNNFQERDRRLAAVLLDSFLFYSTDMIKELFTASIRCVSRDVVTEGSMSERLAKWDAFLGNTVFTFPTGETPFAGDSGSIFCRLARDLLGIPEARVVTPAEALAKAMIEPTNIIFMDDISGSGEQFIHTWHRAIPTTTHSFQTVSQTQQITAYFCPLFCTQYAKEQIVDIENIPIPIRPAHWLTEEDSHSSPMSKLWPPGMREAGLELIKRYSNNLNLPNVFGFRDLGLSIGFAHGVPDVTIPLFTTTENGWRPLWRRS